jgi:transposase-like protein
MKTESKSAQAKIMLAEGKTVSEIAKAVGCNPALVYVVRKVHFPEMSRKYKARKEAPSKREKLIKLIGPTLTDPNATVDDIMRKLPVKWRRLVAQASKKKAVELGLDGAVEKVRESATKLTKKFFEDNAVNHPAHYTTGGIEVYDFIKAKKLSYELGNVVKYVSRAEYKANKLQDLQKARWYLDAAIKQEEGV